MPVCVHLKLTCQENREDNRPCTMFTRELKRLVARTSIAALLFTQMAVAAYACPVIDGPANVIAAAVAGAEMQAAMPGCDMRDSEIANPNLCLQHCQAGEQAVQTQAHVEVPAFASISTVLVVAPAPPQYSSGITVASVLPEHATPPPLIRFGVLRI